MHLGGAEARPAGAGKTESAEAAAECRAPALRDEHILKVFHGAPALGAPALRAAVEAEQVLAGHRRGPSVIIPPSFSFYMDISYSYKKCQ
jgi:hypothetical protein